jgi:pyridoxal phosphate enzyme (YggS family)
MGINKLAYEQLLHQLAIDNVTLVAVSKTKPVEAILSLYELGQRNFGENYVQELITKVPQLPSDINWHFIGHLQSNKVKLIVPLVQLIHGVDSAKLLKEINKEAAKCGKVVDCLLQMHIAQEETKFGLNEQELEDIIEQINTSPLPHVRIVGLMGMASFTQDVAVVRNEFKFLKKIFEKTRLMLKATPSFQTLSMGMSSDYETAIAEGATMVRIGSLLFGAR